MKKLLLMTVLILALPVSGLARDESDRSAESSGPEPVQSIALSDVPEAAMESARKEKPDVYFNQAERLIWKDEPVYRVMGVKGRTEWSVYVNVTGQVFHIDKNLRESGK